MRSTITIEDNLFKQASEICGKENISSVVSEALTAYVRAAAARRLIALGGTAPELRTPSGNRYSPSAYEVKEHEPLKAAEGEVSYNTGR